MDEHNEPLLDDEENGSKPGQLDVLRGPKDKRVNLGAVVRVGPEHIPVSDVDTTIPAGYKQPDLEDPGDHDTEKWDKLKVERNAITAFMIADMWPQVAVDIKRHRADGSDLGLLHLEYNPVTRMMPEKPFSLRQIQDPIRELQGATALTLDRSLSTWVQEQEHRQSNVPPEQQTPIDRAYARLKHIIDFGNEHGDRYDETLEFFIHRGIATATSAIWGVLEVIPRVYEKKYGRQITAGELRSIAQNSYPLVLRIAAGHNEIAASLLDALEDQSMSGSDRPLDAKNFMLSDEGDQTSLEIPQEVLDTLPGYDGHPVVSHIPTSDTTGCPAMHAKTASGKNVIAEMWEWSLELSEKAYFPMYASVEGKEHTPEVVSREAYSEGGYTFLKRALASALRDPNGRVIISTGNLTLTYVHRPENQTFMDGIVHVEGESEEAMEAFRAVAGSYRIQQGLAELEEAKDK